jgi:alpha-L-fucosidase
LRELLTHYGPVFEVWFDGANGGDGYYGGAREKRTIDNRTYYDWRTPGKSCGSCNPMPVCSATQAPDIRWVGNESGFAGDPCWATINTEGMWPGHADQGHLNRGDRHGAQWLPAEVDVSIRPGWFYHATEDDAVKSAAQLRKIYFESVGAGANLLLNLPPDRRGLIHENDVASLRKWHEILQATFATDLAHGAKATASNTRGGDLQFAPDRVTDAARDTYWSSDDENTTPELVLELGEDKTFNVVRLREYLPLGQRVDTFALDAWNDGKWQEFASAASIGNARLVSTPNITTSKVRLRITEAAACPAISEFGLFQMPVRLEEPRIKRGRDGLVTISGHEPEVVIAIPCNGSEPTATQHFMRRLFRFCKAAPSGRAHFCRDENIEERHHNRKLRSFQV